MLPRRKLTLEEKLAKIDRRVRTFKHQIAEALERRKKMVDAAEAEARATMVAIGKTPGEGDQ